MPPHAQLDPVSLLLLVFTAILGPQFAPAATVYTIIGLGSFIGLMIGVRRRDPTSRMGTLVYSIVTMTTSIVMTVWISELVGPHLPGGSTEWLYFPISLMTTAYGEVWMEKLQGFTAMLGSVFTRDQK